MRVSAILLCLVAPLFASTSLGALTTFNTGLDNGTTVRVDNASSMSNAWVGNLVLAADRSTQEDCPYDAPNYKGLFKTGDVVFVSDKYIAWFDYSLNSGTSFPVPPFGGDWWRSGELAGWWTLDPATDYFKHWTTGPNSCWNWPRNELVPGSASPNRERHWWDKYGPSIEHSFEVAATGQSIFMSYHYARWTPSSNWQKVLDGVQDAAGVHYKTSARMTSWTHHVDVVDDNDSAISNSVQAEVEYIARPDDMLVIWRFRPISADVVVKNLFIYLWSGYAQDIDGTSCDVSASGSQWPNSTFGQYRYTQSNLSLWQSWTGQTFPAQQIRQLALGPTCPTPHVNYDLKTSPPFAVGDGTWLRIGESSNLAAGSRKWQLTNVGVPNSGSGTTGDPYKIAWDSLGSWNETRDGTLGFGAFRGPYANPAQYLTLQVGKWYQASIALKTGF